jgi:ABC-type branched-subunit amino acid transport system substrate-binding protein
MQDCDIKIPDNSLYINSAYDPETTIKTLFRFYRDAVHSGEEKLFCGVVGPIDSRASERVSFFSELLSVPQLAYATIDSSLEKSADFASFRRVIPKGGDFASTIAEYVQRDIWQRDFLGILSDASSYGEQFEDPIRDTGELYGLRTLSRHLREGEDESIEDALEEVIKRGYRTMVLITDRPAFLDDIAHFADEKGMLDGGYFWIISGDAFPPALEPHLKYEVDSATDKLLRGAALFTNYDRFVYEGESNAFLQEWRNQSSSLVEGLNAMVPRKSNDEPYYVADHKTYFQTEIPTEYSSFIYDAVMTLGISACKASLRGNKKSGHIQQVVTTEFHGASGPLTFYDELDKEYKTSRNVEGVMFGMYNVRPGPVDENKMRR